jgi:tRNA/rRNA methyltransferase
MDAQFVPRFPRINVVLVRPIYPRNTGMCSRAISNIGAGRLILIAPRFDPAAHEAKQGAANGQRALAAATVYKSLDEFYEHEGSGTRIALTGRDNRLRQPEALDAKLESLLESEKISAQLGTSAEGVGSVGVGVSKDLFISSKPIYLFFGTEDDGLSADEMKLCHHLCSLPVDGEVTSLNLSHAVLLTLHIVAGFLKRTESAVLSAQAATAATTPPTPRTPLSPPKKAYYPEKTIDSWLEALGFSLDQPKVNVALTLHRMLLDNQPREEDLRILDTILQQNIRKLKEIRGK